MKSIIKVTLLSFLLSLSYQTVAAKYDNIYTSSKCQPFDYSSSPNFRYKDGRTMNTNKTSKTLICPIRNDITSEKKLGITQFKVNIKVVDNSYPAGDAKVKCGINTRSYDGRNIDSSWGSSQPGATTSVQELSISHSVDSNMDGYLLLVCSVPGYDDVSGERRYSSIVSYRLAEVIQR